MKLGELHALIQALFSWLGHHLHVFEAADVACGDPSVEGDAPATQRDERPVRLEDDALLRWRGGDFEPDGFDRDAINRRLHGQPEAVWPPRTRRR